MAESTSSSTGPSAPPHSGSGGGSHGTHAHGSDSKAATRVGNLKTNAAYLALGNKAAVKPGSVATRSLLTTLRYVLRYAVRRMLRVAKYAAIGGAIAFVGTGVLGAIGTGVAWFAAPGMLGGMGMGITWAIIKFTWRHRPERFRGGWWSEMAQRASEGRSPEADESTDSGEADAAIKQKMENKRVRQDVWMRAEAV